MSFDLSNISSFNPSDISNFNLKKQGLKTKPKGNGEEVPTTKETLAELKRKVLPFGRLGMRFRTIDVFWTRMSRVESCNPSRFNEDSSAQENGAWKAARPPDGIVAPIWRYCHMGILLQSFKDGEEEDAGLTVAIHLLKDGIHMEHAFGTASQEEVICSLRNEHGNGTIHSAGVARDIDVELQLLVDFVGDFKTSGYSVVGFNCQHVTTILYHKFTQQCLKDNLRRRWTSNKDYFGNTLNDVEQKKKSMQWASKSPFLMEQLEPVEGEPLLFNRSPPAAGKLMKTAALVGAAAARRSPATAVALVAAAVISETNFFRRFKRSVIWFKYDEEKEEWFWSPYRDQEYEGDDFWISIHQREVPGGHFAGSVLEGTSARIANILANNVFNPLSTDDGEAADDCPICLEPKSASMLVSSGNCNHSICRECFGQLDICPFCRVEY